MSVEEMAEMLIEETEAPLSGEPFLRTPDGELFNEYEEQSKNKAISHTIQWLLQEVSKDITRVKHNSLCETETYESR
jgi:hypothetical protein